MVDSESIHDRGGDAYGRCLVPFRLNCQLVENCSYTCSEMYRKPASLLIELAAMDACSQVSWVMSVLVVAGGLIRMGERTWELME